VLAVADSLDHVAVYGPDGHLLDVLRQPDARVTTPSELDVASRDAADAVSEGSGFIGKSLDASGDVLLVAALPSAEPHGYVAAVLPVRRLEARVRSVARDRGLAVTVTDERWHVLADSRDTPRGTALPGSRALEAALPRQGAMRVGAAAEFEHHRTPSMGIAETLPDLGWRVVVTRSLRDVYATVAAMERRMALTAAALAVVILALNVVLGLWLTRALRALTEGVRHFGKGDLKYRVVVRSRDELADLATALNTMSSDIDALRTREHEQQRVRDDLARYLPSEVVDRVVTGEESLALGGTERHVVVLFADVVGFSRVAQKLPPEQVVALLNELFTYLTDIIFQHGGMVDKFIGDCVMAVWGTRGETDPGKNVESALATAEAMMAWLSVGNARWKTRYGLTLQIGVGIHTGAAVAGNLGSDRRMEFTVIGDTVNIASRLESIAPPDTVLVSEAVRALAGDGYDFERVGERTLRGQDKPMEVYAFRYG
jgi:class 3 adenylate cyclase